ncbi:hypothetical protein PAAG_01853 [Paracoccidioides lutzii Pb01]|uniref:Golgi apparatus membrane protein TVP18 n=1 Tax=Paracoccidioides lutzii (strain ATCC MYA-826 / Pb01) TaxID=502779 RepID=C1GTK8_PARBA|nr:hypothetical protein PAAG_01853 [Paracoccidioides lutzii Pb01]EEH39664.2 hypothetical protein PAAG_01853 [Paracoccidioides lutzii Pb01]
MTIAEEFKSRNFSIYGQWLVKQISAAFVACSKLDIVVWLCYMRIVIILKKLAIGAGGRLWDRPQWMSGLSTGVLCILLCFALGIANIFHIRVIAFSIVCLASSFLLIFVEIPLLLRICPTSSKFDAFVRRFTTNYMRALMYLILSVIQWLSIIVDPTSLIAAAIFLLLAGVFYLLAGLTNQEFMSSKTLGGQGVAQMII